MIFIRNLVMLLSVQSTLIKALKPSKSSYPDNLLTIYQVELVPGGRKLPVTSENCQYYAALCEYTRLHEAVL